MLSEFTPSQGGEGQLIASRQKKTENFSWSGFLDHGLTKVPKACHFGSDADKPEKFVPFWARNPANFGF